MFDPQTMTSAEKLQALKSFLGPELLPEYSGLIRDLSAQAEKEASSTRSTTSTRKGTHA